MNDFYALQKRFGSVDVRYCSIQGLEILTPTSTNYLETNYLLKGVVLPFDQSKKFYYDIGYLAANKNFTYGGLVEQLDCKLVLDATVLRRKGLILKDDDFVYFSQPFSRVRKYQIAKITSPSINMIVLMLKSPVGLKPNDAINATCQDYFPMEDRCQ